MNKDIDVSDEEMNSLTQSIFLRYGIDFTGYEPKSLCRRVIRVLNHFNLTSITELWIMFLRDPKFVNSFMDEVSVGMTSMFRDPVLWKNLKTVISKDFAAKKSITVWHAGCSTGEEVFSLGILLQEMNLQEKSWALATDFNQKAIMEAQVGTYHKIKMHDNERNYRDINPFSDFKKYYSRVGMYDTMNSDLVKHATFKYHNLITDAFPEGFDIIFCRNVMIYFDTVTKAKLLDKFYTALNPGGIFIIGFFDTMSVLMDNTKFFLFNEEAKIFKKQ